jgi:death-on-curing protein
METVFPTVEEALYLHSRLLEEFGGKAGIRDLGLLESALFRPRTGHYRTLSEQAAALMQSLAVNHAFVDGNKRMAFALTAVFLMMNGYTLSVPAREAEEFLVTHVIVERIDLNEITIWLESHMSVAE